MGQKRECTQIRTIGFQQRYKGERITFSTDGAGTTVHPFAKEKMNFSPYLALFIIQNINSKLIIDLNVKPQIIKFPEANLKACLCDLGTGRFLRYQTKRTIHKRDKMDKSDFTKT